MVQWCETPGDALCSRPPPTQARIATRLTSASSVEPSSSKSSFDVALLPRRRPKVAFRSAKGAIPRRPFAGAKGDYPAVPEVPFIVAFRSAKGAFRGRPFAGAKGDYPAVPEVPFIVAFRSAKGAFRGRRFAGAKGDYQTPSSRARASQRWRRQRSAADRCLAPRKTTIGRPHRGVPDSATSLRSHRI
jgi:hypothetical protein